MWFDLARKEGFPSQYPTNATPVTIDVLEAGFICAFLIIAFCCIISFPSPIGSKTVNRFIRVVVSLLIGLFIFLSNFGQEWEVAHITSNTQYKAGVSQMIKADIGVKIGLRSVNITLKSTPPKDSSLGKEIIDYNERFSWTWDQGRFGFGPYAGEFQREFRAAQYQGVPYPILWIAEYFVIDGEGFRMGRFYRTAGWWTHIAIWAAFPCWLLANILFRSVIRYGAYMLATCGGLLLLGNLLWLVIRNPVPIIIPFEEATIRTKFGFSFWLTFFTGIMCGVIAIALIFCDTKYDVATSVFFEVDPLKSYEECHLTPQEMTLLRKKESNGLPKGSLPLLEMGNSAESSDYDLADTILKRRTTVRGITPKLKRVHISPNPDEIYGNFEAIMEHEATTSRRK